MKTNAVLVQEKMQTNMNTYFLDHTIQLQSVLTDFVEMRTDIFVKLQIEKTLLKNELITEIPVSKDELQAELQLETGRQKITPNTKLHTSREQTSSSKPEDATS